MAIAFNYVAVAMELRGWVEVLARGVTVFASKGRISRVQFHCDSKSFEYLTASESASAYMLVGSVAAMFKGLGQPETRIVTFRAVSPVPMEPDVTEAVMSAEEER